MKEEAADDDNESVVRPAKRARFAEGRGSFGDRVRRLVGDFSSLPEVGTSQIAKFEGQAQVRAAYEHASARVEVLTREMDVLSFETSCVSALRDRLGQAVDGAASVQEDD